MGRAQLFHPDLIEDLERVLVDKMCRFGNEYVNILIEEGFWTFEMLLSATEQQLRNEPNFSEYTLYEIQKLLHAHGLGIGMSGDVLITTVEAHRRRLILAIPPGYTLVNGRVISAD